MASRLSTEPLGRPEPGQILIVIRKYTFFGLEAIQKHLSSRPAEFPLQSSINK
jgi:hypothetical protein